MKSELFTSAILNRNQVRFLYGLSEIMLDPYFIAREKNGKKVLYGRTNNSCEVKKFEFCKIANIKVLKNVKFSPVIPIIN